MNVFRLRFVSIPALGLAALLACGRTEEKPSAAVRPTSPAAAESKTEAAPKALPGPLDNWKRVEGVAARVNGVEITRDEVERRAARIVWSLALRREEKSVPEDEAEDVRRNVLDTLVEMELLFQEATRLGFTALPEEIEGAMRMQKMRFAEEKHFHEALATQGRTESELRAEMARQIVVDKYLETAVYEGKQEVTEEEARAFYGMLVEKFEKRYPGRTPPRFEAQKRQIYETIRQEKRQMLRAEAAEFLMEEGKVEFFDDAP